MAAQKETREGMHLIFVRWITNRKTGARIYPRSGKAFPIWVKN